MSIQKKESWHCDVSLRICHSELNPDEISEMLAVIPKFSNHPGNSKVPYRNCRSAGYWCYTHRVMPPDLPDAGFVWMEEFVASRKKCFYSFLDKEYDVDVYVGVFSSLLSLGFSVPSTPSLWELRIPVGMEIFSS